MRRALMLVPLVLLAVACAQPVPPVSEVPAKKFTVALVSTANGTVLLADNKTLWAGAPLDIELPFNFTGNMTLSLSTKRVNLSLAVEAFKGAVARLVARAESPKTTWFGALSGQVLVATNESLVIAVDNVTALVLVKGKWVAVGSTEPKAWADLVTAFPIGSRVWVYGFCIAQPGAPGGLLVAAQAVSDLDTGVSAVRHIGFP